MMEESERQRRRQEEDAGAALVDAEAGAREGRPMPPSARAPDPGDYLRSLLSGAVMRLAEHMGGVHLVLPWLLVTVGTPIALIGWLAPVRQVALLVAQALFGGVVRDLSQGKWVWAASATIQAMCLLAVIPAALGLAATTAGLAVLALVAVFSIAQGIGLLGVQHVAAHTVPLDERGRLLRNRALLGGALTVVAGITLYASLGPRSAGGLYAALVGAAGFLWILAGMLAAQIREHAGATAGGYRGAEAMASEAATVRTASHAGHRAYLVATVLLVTVELSSPFYALHAWDLFTGSFAALGACMTAMGVGDLLAGRVWRRLSGRPARSVLMVAGTVAAATALFALATDDLLSGDRGWPLEVWLFAAVFIGLGVATSGIRLGRARYRRDTMAVAGAGVDRLFSPGLLIAASIFWGGLGWTAQVAGTALVLALLAVVAMAGVAVAALIPKRLDRVPVDTA